MESSRDFPKTLPRLNFLLQRFASKGSTVLNYLRAHPFPSARKPETVRLPPQIIPPPTEIKAVDTETLKKKIRELVEELSSAETVKRTKLEIALQTTKDQLKRERQRIGEENSSVGS
jgi:predicted Zn-dependent protease